MRLKSQDLFQKITDRTHSFVESVLSVEGVKAVRINPLTRNVVIIYDWDKITDRDLLREIAGKNGREKRIRPNFARLFGYRILKRRQLNFFRYDSFISAWEIEHDLPGRLRIKHPFLWQRKTYCQKVHKTLYGTAGVKKFKVSTITSSVLINYDDEKIAPNSIIWALEQSLASAAFKKAEVHQEDLPALPLSTFSLGASALGAFYFPWMIPLNIGLILYTAAPIFKKAWLDIKKHRKLKVDVLDTTVIIFCLGMNQYVAAAFMVWILDAADMLLDKTANESKKLLGQIFGKQARFAYLLRGKEEEQVSLEQLVPGDTIVVHTGEHIPIDGEVKDGEAMVDQHSLTGESAPVEKRPGDKVYAATVVLGGKIYVTVTTTTENTEAAKIVRILGESASYKTKLHSAGERLADKMVIPTLSLGGLGYTLAGPSASLAIINADYGTGIRVAAPMAVLSSLARAAKEGIIVKNGAALEELLKVNSFVFDKTGTLTHEVPEVSEIICCSGRFDPEQVLAYAAAAEQRFSHPIARAVIQRAQELKLRLPKRDESKYHVGFGIEVMLNKNLVKVGSIRYMGRERIRIPLDIQKRLKGINQSGSSAILVAVNNSLAGAITLRSSHRPEAYDVIQRLRKRGIEDIVLLSGDHQGPTKDIAQRLGIERYYAGVLPQEKAKYVELLQREGKKVGMAGDGINDSVALSRADVSVSLMGASDIATDVADIVFMEDSLEKFDTLFTIAHGLKSNVERSFGLIVVPNTICITGAMLGLVGLPISLILNNFFNFAATMNGMLPLYSAIEYDNNGDQEWGI